MPQLKQSAGLGEQSLPNWLRCSTAFGDLVERANQVGPAHLPPREQTPTVAAPPIRHQIPGKLAQQRFGRLLAAAQMPLKDCHPTRHQYPQPGFAPLWIGAIAVTLHPAGLICMRRVLGLRKLVASRTGSATAAETSCRNLLIVPNATST